MLKIAYLILAHRNPRLIQALVRRLSCKNCAFYIHIDQKFDIEGFAAIKSENVFFLQDRVRVSWAEFTVVEATLKLMQAALEASQKYEYFVLLSGSDYPLRNTEYIHSFFERHRGSEFIGMARIPSTEAGVPLSRIKTIRYPTTAPLRRFLFRGLAKLALAQRDHRQALGIAEAYGGSQWWALSAAACHYILDTDRADPRFRRFFGLTSAPDELFFHTILGNSRFKEHIRRNVMYEDWTNIVAHSPHPALLTKNHIEAFEETPVVTCSDAFGPGEMLFARKFSDDTLGLIKLVDHMIEVKDGIQPQAGFNSSGGERN